MEARGGNVFDRVADARGQMVSCGRYRQGEKSGICIHFPRGEPAEAFAINRRPGKAGPCSTLIGIGDRDF